MQQQWLGRMARGAAKMLFALLCVVVAAYAFAYLYLEFRSNDAFAIQFAVSGLDVPAHFFVGGLALLLAPLQLSSRLRNWMPALHRQLGWLYAGAVLLGSVAGLSLAMHAQGGLPARVVFVALAVLWPCVTAIGIRHAIAGDIVRHRRWMCRSVALTWSAVTLRLILIGGVAAGLPFMTVYVAAAWLGWTVNLAVCEILLRWPAIRARRAAYRDSGVIVPASGTVAAQR